MYASQFNENFQTEKEAEAGLVRLDLMDFIVLELLREKRVPPTVKRFLLSLR